MILSTLMSLFALFLRITVFLGGLILKFIGIIILIVAICVLIARIHWRDN